MRRLASSLVHDWQLKLLSVAFALALWGFVVSEDRGEATFVVPLSFVDLPAGLQITGGVGEAVSVRVRALRRALPRLSEADFEVRASLAGASAGEWVGRIPLRGVRAPRGVHVAGVTPSRFRVQLDLVPAERQ